MTITSSVNKVQIASGSSINVSNLGATDSSQIVVTRLESDNTETTLVLNTDYSIDNDLTTVTLNTAIDGTTYKRASVTLNIPETQSSNYVNVNPHNTEVTEADLDKITLKMKQIQENLDRVVAAPISTPSGSFDLPNLDGQAGKYLKLNATEDGFEFADISSITFWESFTFPSGDGSSEQYLQTDGSNQLSWSSNDFSSTLEGIELKALLNYNQSTNTIVRQNNIASVADNSAGDFTITFTNAMDDANYHVIAFARSTSNTLPMVAFSGATSVKTTTQLQILTWLSGTGLTDSTEVMLLVYV